MQKLLKLISIAERHPDMMTVEQISEWMSVLRTLESVRVVDPDGATHLRCAHGVFQGKFSVLFGNIAKMDVVLTRVHPESKKYSVSSKTEYYNVGKSYHGTKHPNTWQRELLRQQEFFQEQQRETMHRAVEQHQHAVQHHMQHVAMVHHHHHF
jgi:hypothetical protein